MNGLRYAAISHPGKVRSRNEDAWGIFRPGAEALNTGEGEYSGELQMTDAGAVLVVSDGMGGAKAGDYASRTIVETLHERAGEGQKDPAGYLRTTLEVVHRRLIRESEDDSEKSGMGGTCTLGWINPQGQLLLVHVGDSRLYRWRNGELARWSEDQTVAAQFVANGEISEAEARNSRYWHVLIQAIGGGEDRPINPQVSLHRVVPGDRLLLCSDGITDGLLDADLLGLLQKARRMKNLTEASHSILNAALDASGRDNATLILAEVY